MGTATVCVSHFGCSRTPQPAEGFFVAPSRCAVVSCCGVCSACVSCAACLPLGCRAAACLAGSSGCLRALCWCVRVSLCAALPCCGVRVGPSALALCCAAAPALCGPRSGCCLPCWCFAVVPPWARPCLPCACAAAPALCGPRVGVCPSPGLPVSSSCRRRPPSALPLRFFLRI